MSIALDPIPAMLSLDPNVLQFYHAERLLPEEPLAPGIQFVSVHAWFRAERGYCCQWCGLRTTRPTLAGCAGKTKGGTR